MEGQSGSFMSKAWSCNTLAEGVAACAQIAGINLEPHQLADARKACGVLDLNLGCHQYTCSFLEMHIYIWMSSTRFFVSDHRVNTVHVEKQ